MDRDHLDRLWREAASHRAAPADAVAVPPGPLSPATFMGAPAATEDDLLGADLAVLGLPLGAWPDAPAAVRAASRRFTGWLAAAQAETGVRVVDYGDVAVDGGDLAGSFLRAHERLVDVLAAGATPVVLGGDALATLPVLQVLAGKLQGRLGVVAFAPQLDLDQAAAGTAAGRWSLALELGVCEPRNVVLIGERGDPGQARARRMCEALGVRRYGLSDVAEAGIVTVAREALAAAAAGTEAVYVSVDLGVAEGAGDPLGLRATDLSVALGIVAASRLAAADVCGVDRAADGGCATVLAARLVGDLILAVGGGRA